jgi:hypothetical protein
MGGGEGVKWLSNNGVEWLQESWFFALGSTKERGMDIGRSILKQETYCILMYTQYKHHNSMDIFAYCLLVSVQFVTERKKNRSGQAERG